LLVERAIFAICAAVSEGVSGLGWVRVSSFSHHVGCFSKVRVAFLTLNLPTDRGRDPNSRLRSGSLVKG
jgi:hypothetical protein